MRISAAGNPSRRRAGFTLLELLVVVAIVAMVSVGVGLAMRDSSMVQLERDAQRLAAVLESARARSRLNGLPVRWQPSAQGFRFEGLGDADLPGQWLDSDTGVVDTPVLLLGPEPIIEAQEVVLFSKTHPQRRVRVATDGVQAFALKPATP